MIGRTIYGIGKDRNTDDYFVFKLPDKLSDPLAVQTAVKTPWKDIEYHMPGIFTDSVVASPLYVDGLIYLPSQGGAMNVDRRQHRPACLRPRDGFAESPADVGLRGWNLLQRHTRRQATSTSATTRARRWSCAPARGIRNYPRICWSSTARKGRSPKRRATSSSKAGGFTSARGDSCTASGPDCRNYFTLHSSGCAVSRSSERVKGKE